jgi:predicted deacetylase
MALPAPSLYVPPAWAMGRISRAGLRKLPFRYYETISGVYDAQADRFIRLPLLGFEADTRIRATALKLSNVLNRRLANAHRELRFAIHPTDFELYLARDLGGSLCFFCS